MVHRLFRLLTVLLIAVSSTPAAAQFAGNQKKSGFDFGSPQYGDSRDQVDVSIQAARTKIAPGQSTVIAVVFDIADNWHIWPNAGNTGADKGYDVYDSALYTTLNVSASPESAITPEGVQWPKVHGVEANLGGGRATYGVFERRAIAYIPVRVAEDAATGEATINVVTTFQACDDRQCMFPTPDVPLAVKLNVVPEGEAAAPVDYASTDLFAGYEAGAASAVTEPADAVDASDNADSNVEFDVFGIVSFNINAAGAGFILLLLVAALGGVLLNFTPCVLPVIPLKIMGLSSAAGNRRRTLFLGTIMSLGVVFLWLVIGGALALLTSFSNTNQLFQYPAFNIGIGLFIALMAVGMCGLFSIRLPRFVYGINPSHESPRGSFVFGIMTGILALPCIGPFMGAAAAFASNLAPLQTLSVFLAIGIGMALPYQILSTFPHLVERMPRTGPASELIKQVMGLLMLAAAAYFVGTGLSGWLSEPPAPPTRAYLWIVAAFGVAAGLWLLWRTVRITPRVGRRIIFGGLGLFIAAFSVWVGVNMTRSGPIDWVYYTPERFDAAKRDGKVVVMEFTAEWCLNCKALEATVLHTDRVADLLDDADIVPIKVDLTGGYPAGREMLVSVGRVSIPLLVVFRPDGTAVFTGDFYTVNQVVNAVEQARATPVAVR